MHYWREGILVQYNARDFILVESVSKNSLQITVSPTLQSIRLLGEVVDHLDAMIEEWYCGLLEVTPSGKSLLNIMVSCTQCACEDEYKFKLDNLISLSEDTTTVFCQREQQYVPIQDLVPDVFLMDIPEQFHVTEENLQFEESACNVIGDGTFGHVYKAVYNGTPVAIKKFASVIEKYGYKALRHEAVILSKLSHPSLVQMVGVDAREKLLILELAQYGSLRDVIWNGTPISRIVKHRMAIQIVEGLKYVHERMIIYRDMKPDNILVYSCSQSDPVNVKISDYGIARLATPSGLKSPEGTPGYRAPEIINNQQYSLKADVFSYGVTLYELFTNGKHPYGEPGVGYQLDENISHGIPPRIMNDHAIDGWAAMRDIILQCLRYNPDDRPFPSEIIERLNRVETLCTRHSLIQSKQNIESTIVMPLGNSLDVLITCGGDSITEMMKITLHEYPSVNGSLFTLGHILCTLTLPDTSDETLVVGTMCGFIYFLDSATLLPKRQRCNLQDSILCLTYITGKENERAVVAGTAGGCIAIFSEIDLLYSEQEPEIIQLGTISEPVTSMIPVNSRHGLYLAVASRIYYLKLFPKIVLQSKYSFDLEESDGNDVILRVLKFHKELHIIKKWGHKIYKLSIKSTPYIKSRFDVLSYLNRQGGCNANSFDSRLLSMCLVPSTSTLWAGTAHGCLVLLDVHTYKPLVHLQLQTTDIRNLFWQQTFMNESKAGSVIVCSRTFTNEKCNKYICECCPEEREVNIITVLDADLNKEITALQEYTEKRANLIKFEQKIS